MRRWYGPTILALVILGGAAWYAARQPWLHVVVGTAAVPGSSLDLAGRDIVEWLSAFGGLIAAAGLGVLASAGRVRRAVGVLIVATGAGGLYGCFADPTSAIAQKVAESPAFIGADDWSSADTLWRFVTPGLFAATTLLGVLVVVCARRWPTMSTRYETGPAAVTESTDPLDLWKALDDGRDPTL